MVLFPHCKINLGLQIVSKRTDGYHNIVSCFLPVPWTDMLEIIPSDKLHLQTSGNFIPGKVEDNLCLKAFHLLQADFKIPFVQIHLHKSIPTGAGLGGGSSDGAFTLRILNHIFSLGLSVAEMKQYASKLGSDCPFFIEDNAMLGTGRGEVLEPISLSLKNKFIIIVNPDVHVATAEAYQGVKPALPSIELKYIVENTPVDQWRDVVKNDFEETVFEKFPVIKTIKQKMYQAGAVYASMSGSGSAVFGIFNQETKLPTEFAGMISWSGSFA
jgi:4-diphosphocytidyl-2-C-methyl-D-erythritol kinase